MVVYGARERVDIRAATGGKGQQQHRARNQTAVRIVIVGQNIDRDRCVGRRRGRVIEGDRKLVVAFDEDRGRGDVRHHARGVADGVGEVVHARESCRRGVGELAATGIHCAAMDRAPDHRERGWGEHAGTVEIVGKGVDEHSGVFRRDGGVICGRGPCDCVLYQDRDGSVIGRAVSRWVVVRHHDVRVPVLVQVCNRQPLWHGVERAACRCGAGGKTLARMEGSGRVAQINRHIVGLAVGDDYVAIAIPVHIRDGDRDGVGLDGWIRPRGQGGAEGGVTAVGLSDTHADQIVGGCVDIVRAERCQIRNAVAVDIAHGFAASGHGGGRECAAAGAEIDRGWHDEIEMAITVEIGRGDMIGLLGQKPPSRCECAVSVAGEKMGVPVHRVDVGARYRHHQIGEAVFVEIAVGYRAGAAPRGQARQLQREGSVGRAQEDRNPGRRSAANPDERVVSRTIEAFRGHQIENAIVVEIRRGDARQIFTGEKIAVLRETALAVSIKQGDAVHVRIGLGRGQVRGGHQIKVAVPIEISDGDAISNAAAQQIDGSRRIEHDSGTGPMNLSNTGGDGGKT